MPREALEARISRITATVSDEETPVSALELLRESYWLKAPVGVWKRPEPSPPPKRRPRRPGSLRGSGTGDSSSSSLRSSHGLRLRCPLQDVRALRASVWVERSGTSDLSLAPSIPKVSCSDMKVVLPDNSELELPDGATGLDAAAAIGPKLAEQAVLVRSNGDVQDLRQPLEDGQKIEILTTRDKDDPDALYVLRHSTAHLLAEAVRRLYPGVKIAIGPPIENGFYYDFEFPEPIGEEALERIEAEMRLELEEGREWSREEVSREEARERFLATDEPYKVELVDTADGDISFYTQGDFIDLCRGPHLQNSTPIKAIKLTGLAGAYWRGDERNKQLTRIYGTAFYDQADLDAYLEQLEEARRRDHRRLGTQLDLFHLSEHAPGMPFWHPKGMVIWNELEDLRRRENLKRGYLEVRTPIIYDAETFVISGHFPKYEDLMFKLEVDQHQWAMKAMNCPGHMLLFGSKLRSYRELP